MRGFSIPFINSVGDAFKECNALRSEVAKLRKELAEEERSCSQLIDERDTAQDAADNLVYCIERLLDVDCGEHSNLNCPWTEAFELAEAEIDRRKSPT
jgi:hypothetical protein